MKLSILIASLYQRGDMLANLMNHLSLQMSDKVKKEIGNFRYVFNEEVEIIAHCDNGQISIGEKRNTLLAEAKGDYIVFIDDDDMVPDYYIDEILKGVETGCDSMAINGIMTTNGEDKREWLIYQGSEYNDQGGVYHRFPNHITPVKRGLALAASFPLLNNGEDYQYAVRLKDLGLLKTEYIIRKPMYHYQYLTYNKTH